MWYRVAHVEGFLEGTAREVVAGDRLIALYLAEGQFHALDGVCPHQGGPLGKGDLSGCIITCPWHGWQFDVRTGQQQVTATIVQSRFPVKVENGSVFVGVDEDDNEDNNSGVN